jgi:transforming growth factor-beta-induced protein
VHPTTQHPRRRLLALTAIATLSLVAAACGDDDDNEPAAAADQTAATAAPAESAMSEEAGQMAGQPFGPACSAVPDDGEGSFGGMADDPAATAASNNPVLSTLVSAVMQAGLADTLNSEGPFTIFAPTNDAFAAIPQADLEAVLADKDLLTNILTYHVVAGESLKASDLATAGELTTVEGDALMFGSDGTTVNGAHVVCSDVTTANATVHIIDSVLMPPASEMSGEMSEDMTDSMTG